MAGARLVCFSSLAFLFAGVVATTQESEVDGEVNVPNISDLQDDPLRQWLEQLIIPLPGNASHELPMEMGVFTIISGHCSGLTLSDIKSQDLSENKVLEIAMQVKGIGISCWVQGKIDDGTMDINISLANTSMNMSLQIHPRESTMVENLPLPMGPLKVSDCGVDLEVASMTWAGSSFLVETLDEIGEFIIPMIGEFVNQPLCDGVKDYIEVQGSGTLDFASEVVQMLLIPPEPNPVPQVLKPLLDMGAYPPVQVVKALVAERFSLAANRMLNILDITKFNATLVALDMVSIVLSSLSVEGRCSSEEPPLVVRADGPDLGITANMSNMVITGTLDLFITLTGQPAFLPQVNLSIGLEEVSMGVQARLDIEEIRRLEADQALQSPTCLVQTAMHSTDPQEEALQVAPSHVGLRPLLRMQGVGLLEREGSDLVNAMVAALYREYLPTMTALVDGALSLVRDPLNTMIWDNLRTVGTCSRDDLFWLLSEQSIRILWSLAVFIAVLGVPIAGLAHFMRRDASTPEATHGSATAAPTQPKEAVALAWESQVPRAVAVYFPFAAVAVLILFGYADLDLGATVTVVMEYNGGSSIMGPVFAFSLVGTVLQTWQSSAYFICVLTVIASGVWPLIKLCTLVFAWYAPPKHLSVTMRGNILRFLDTWGKFSFLDSWFLVICLSGFDIEWRSVGSAALKIRTTPMPAFYAFLMATVLSLVLGHVASEYHHAVESKAKLAIENAKVQDPRDLVPVHKAAVPLFTFATRRYERVALPIVLGVSTILTLMGTFITSFAFEINGLLSEFLFGGELDKAYSLFSIGMAVAAGRYEETGLVGLEIAFVLLAVAVPAILLVMLLALWVLPLGLVRQKRLAHFCRFMDAWASLDVCALVMTIAVSEFGKLAEWLVYAGNFATPCQMIKDMTKDECLQVQIHAYPMLYVMLLSGVLMVVVPKVAIWASEAAIQKRAQGALDEVAQQKKVATIEEGSRPGGVVHDSNDVDENSPLSGGKVVPDDAVDRA